MNKYQLIENIIYILKCFCYFYADLVEIYLNTAFLCININYFI